MYLASSENRKLVSKQKIKKPTSSRWANANTACTSSNRFKILADQNFMDTDPASNILEVKTRKPPPIVVKINCPLTDIQKLLGNYCVYKQSSIGTKEII